MKNFLLGQMSAGDYVDDLMRLAVPYNGFSLLTWDGEALFFFSNRAPVPIKVAPGIHGVPNQILNTPWPKVVKGRAGLEECCRAPFDIDRHMTLLDDTTPAPDSDLPQRGRPLERERRHSSLRIVNRDYGTRCSSVLRITSAGAIDFAERSFCPDGGIAGDVRYQVRINSSRAEMSA